MLGGEYCSQRNYEKAREITGFALSGLKGATGEIFHDRLLFARALMGYIHLVTGDYETALKHLNEALDGYRMYFWDNITMDASIAELLETLAGIYVRQGRHDQVPELLRQVLQRYENSMHSCTPRRLRRMLTSGDMCVSVGDNQTAVGFYELALVGWDSTQDWNIKTHTDRLWTLHNLGTLYRKQGEYATAWHYCNQVMKGLTFGDQDQFGHTPESYRVEFCHSSSAFTNEEALLVRG
jgi:tetratricopeptide (TPR) repeat protein